MGMKTVISCDDCGATIADGPVAPSPWMRRSVEDTVWASEGCAARTMIISIYCHRCALGVTPRPHDNIREALQTAATPTTPQVLS